MRPWLPISGVLVSVKRAQLQGTSEEFNSYVTVKLQNVKSTTIAVKGNSPCWEQEFIFETSRLEQGLVLEVWNKGLLWDRMVGVHYLPLMSLNYSNVEGSGRWLALERELRLDAAGEASGTAGPTSHAILVDARFELPYDLAPGEAEELQRKLESLNALMDQEIATIHAQLPNHPASARAPLTHSAVSEDSDYTSDVSFPIARPSSSQHHANASLQTYSSHLHDPPLTDEDHRSPRTSRSNHSPRLSARQNRLSAYDSETEMENWNEFAEPLSYNSRPFNTQRRRIIGGRSSPSPYLGLSTLPTSPYSTLGSRDGSFPRRRLRRPSARLSPVPIPVTDLLDGISGVSAPKRRRPRPPLRHDDLSSLHSSVTDLITNPMAKETAILDDFITSPTSPSPPRPYESFPDAQLLLSSTFIPAPLMEKTDHPVPIPSPPEVKPPVIIAKSRKVRRAPLDPGLETRGRSRQPRYADEQEGRHERHEQDRRQPHLQDPEPPPVPRPRRERARLPAIPCESPIATASRRPPHRSTIQSRDKTLGGHQPDSLDEEMSSPPGPTGPPVPSSVITVQAKKEGLRMRGSVRGMRKSFAIDEGQMTPPRQQEQEREAPERRRRPARVEPPVFYDSPAEEKHRYPPNRDSQEFRDDDIYDEPPFEYAESRSEWEEVRDEEPEDFQPQPAHFQYAQDERQEPMPPVQIAESPPPADPQDPNEGYSLFNKVNISALKARHNFEQRHLARRAAAQPPQPHEPPQPHQPDLPYQEPAYHEPAYHDAAQPPAPDQHYYDDQAFEQPDVSYYDQESDSRPADDPSAYEPVMDMGLENGAAYPDTEPKDWEPAYNEPVDGDWELSNQGWSEEQQPQSLDYGYDQEDHQQDQLAKEEPYIEPKYNSEIPPDTSYDFPTVQPHTEPGYKEPAPEVMISEDNWGQAQESNGFDDQVISDRPHSPIQPKLEMATDERKVENLEPGQDTAWQAPEPVFGNGHEDKTTNGFHKTNGFPTTNGFATTTSVPVTDEGEPAWHDGERPRGEAENQFVDRGRVTHQDEIVSPEGELGYDEEKRGEEAEVGYAEHEEPRVPEDFYERDAEAEEPAEELRPVSPPRFGTSDESSLSLAKRRWRHAYRHVCQQLGHQVCRGSRSSSVEGTVTDMDNNFLVIVFLSNFRSALLPTPEAH